MNEQSIGSILMQTDLNTQSHPVSSSTSTHFSSSSPLPLSFFPALSVSPKAAPTIMPNHTVIRIIIIITLPYISTPISILSLMQCFNHKITIRQDIYLIDSGHRWKHGSWPRTGTISQYLQSHWVIRGGGGFVFCHVLRCSYSRMVL